MTPAEVWEFAQLCRRLHPHGHHEADLIERGVAFLELIATKGRRNEH